MNNEFRGSPRNHALTTGSLLLPVDSEYCTNNTRYLGHSAR